MKTHEAMMETVIDAIKKHGFDCIRDHNGEGRVRLFAYNLNEKKIFLSYPDIIVTKDNKVKFIIEVKFKKDNTPKAIMGIIHSTNLSTHYKYKDKEEKLNKPALIIVLDDDLVDKDKKRARKPFQIEFIKEHLDTKQFKNQFKNLSDVTIWSETEFTENFNDK
ncbi:MAG: hypothetical protein L6265_06240 [Thermoplasmatales archaeon]|nr:hypothetical protein [Candidatus Thermoplasmatota archaeon]MCG2826173.1 hypothetical protein [Thermoplasmatales archaeon]